MSSKGSSVSAAFGASASGASTSGSSNSSSGKSSTSQSVASSSRSTGRSSMSVSTSYSTTNYGAQSTSSTPSAPPSISATFNNSASSFAPRPSPGMTFKQTTRDQVAAKNERSQVRYANDQNWQQERNKMAAKAFPEPTNDLDMIRNRNVNLEYKQRLHAYQVRTKAINVRFDRHVDGLRKNGVTLTNKFEQSTKTTPDKKAAAVSGYQRPNIQNNFNEKSLGNDRDR